MQTAYYNGNIITMKDEGIMNIMIVEDDHIIYVGNDMNQINDSMNKIDLEGKTILPGFIDGHSHFMAQAMALNQCDLTKCDKDLVEYLKDYIEENHIEEGKWVQALGYDALDIDVDCHLLDKVSTKHPIVCIHRSMHMGVLNTMALEMTNPKDLPGGKVESDSNGNMTGYLEENCFFEARNHIPPASLEDMVRLMKKASKLYASLGVTTVQEGMVNKELFQILQYFSSQNMLDLDVIGYIDMSIEEEFLQQALQYKGNHFYLGGGKIFLDGSPQGKTAWMSKPYVGTNECGYPTLKDEQVEGYIQKALNNHMQLLAHCNGDNACKQYLSAFEKFKGQELYRPVMVHCQLLDIEDLKRFESLQMIPSFFVSHVYHYGDIHIQNFGKERANHISPVQSAITNHLPYTFHQDCPVLIPDMFETVEIAVRRMTKSGILLGSTQKISVYEALKAITVYGAYQYHQEDIKGTLEAGKLADYIIVDHNPLEIDVDKLHTIKVLETYKEGNLI